MCLKAFVFFSIKSGDPAGTRTQGPNIKSVVLYQLSYEISKECIKASFLLRDGKNTVP